MTALEAAKFYGDFTDLMQEVEKLELEFGSKEIYNYNVVEANPNHTQTEKQNG